MFFILFYTSNSKIIYFFQFSEQNFELNRFLQIHLSYRGGGGGMIFKDEGGSIFHENIHPVSEYMLVSKN